MDKEPDKAAGHLAACMQRSMSKRSIPEMEKIQIKIRGNYSCLKSFAKIPENPRNCPETFTFTISLYMLQLIWIIS